MTSILYNNLFAHSLLKNNNAYAGSALFKHLIDGAISVFAERAEFSETCRKTGKLENHMYACKAFRALRALLRSVAALLLLPVWTSAAEGSCGKLLLPLPNLNADVIVVGKIMQSRADEHSIDIVVLERLNGRLPPSDCWQPSGDAITIISVNTSTLPEECNGIDTSWPEHVFSLSTRNGSRCPSLAYDGLHTPVLPAHFKEERTLIRRQSSLCKLMNARKSMCAYTYYLVVAQ